MLNVAICDDEIEEIERLEGILETISLQQGIRVDVEDFMSGEALLKQMEENNVRYDLIFLDIEMKHLDGLDTAKQIREMDEQVYLIYVTGFESYALEAYEVHPYHFILKPISVKTIEKCFLKIYKNITSETCYYEFQYKKEYYKLPICDIMLFESDKRRINIYLADGTVCTYYDKLSLVEEKLKDRKADFWRIHQSYLVHVKYIRHKAFDYVVLMNGQRYYISENRRKEINEQYSKWIEGQFVE
ncbi:MAG: LytTR family DNA-binding domain-containing protein [Clostridium sp.]|nr:LytTR family DNA-binding domain-containing protein [Clostridium sp.]